MEPADRRLLKITAVSSAFTAAAVAVAAVWVVVALVLTSIPDHSRGLTQVTITTVP